MRYCFGVVVPYGLYKHRLPYSRNTESYYDKSYYKRSKYRQNLNEIYQTADPPMVMLFGGRRHLTDGNKKIIIKYAKKKYCRKYNENNACIERQ